MLELGRWCEPIAHFGLIAVVDLHITQDRETLGTHLQVLANVGSTYLGVVVIPGAPAARALTYLADQRAVLDLDQLCQLGQQILALRPFEADQRLALPVLTGGKFSPFAVHQDLQATIGIEAKLPAKTVAAGKGEQQPPLAMLHQQQVVNGVIAIVIGDAIDAGIRATADMLR